MLNYRSKICRRSLTPKDAIFLSKKFGTTYYDNDFTHPIFAVWKKYEYLPQEITAFWNLICLPLAGNQSFSGSSNTVRQICAFYLTNGKFESPKICNSFTLDKKNVSLTDFPYLDHDQNNKLDLVRLTGTHVSYNYYIQNKTYLSL